MDKTKWSTMFGEATIIQDPDMLASLLINIQQWGIARNITADGGATAHSQLTKLQEELDELNQALDESDNEEVLDAVGDMIVVLVQILRLTGNTLDDALYRAWVDIKDRKGKMIDGVFVKESDLQGD